MKQSKTQRRFRIKRRFKATVSGTSDQPRMSVFRSNKEIYAQLIDDVNGVTVASASSVKNDKAQGVPKIDQAKIVGGDIAEKAKSAGYKTKVSKNFTNTNAFLADMWLHLGSG